jgi:hypothetical protein
LSVDIRGKDGIFVFEDSRFGILLDFFKSSGFEIFELLKSKVSP